MSIQGLDVDMLRFHLKHIKENYDSKVVRDVIETLLKIHRNILHNEEETKYRKIKPDNPAFNKKIWSLYPARQFMFCCGWFEIHNTLVFNSDENLIEIVEILLNNREVSPNADEWCEETKFEGSSEEQLLEETLKEKAVLEREKELKEFLTEKKYREDLAKKIKAEIASDRNKRRIGNQSAVKD